MSVWEFIAGEALIAGAAYLIGRTKGRNDIADYVETWGIITDNEEMTGTLLDDLDEEFIL